jgi:predicted ATPase/DNA-binding CsgD family transcriptional regulator
VSKVQVLATSREPLNLREETRLRIGGLSYPEMGSAEEAIDLASCRGYGAVELFLQSARQVLPSLVPTEAGLGCVARICQMVEGMPLAIILAAAWVETLSLSEIVDELGRSLELLAAETRNMPVRHRSIRAVFDSTWNRMADAERQALMRLSVFRGGFTRDAAQAVTGARLRTLRVLIEKSLVRRDQETGRFELHELLRHYAEDKLEASGTAAGVRDAHSEYYLSGPWQGGERSLDVPGGRERLAQPLVDPLTKRELEVLRLIAAGLSNQEIADQLVVGLSTVKKHINRAYSKLGVHRRTRAILRAQALGLL